MEKPPTDNVIALSQKASKSLTLSSTKPSAAKLREARDIVVKLIYGFPDYGKASPEYVLTLTEFVASLSPQEIALITDPKSGIAARCKFLPAIFDFAEILREFEASQAKYSNIRDYSGLRPMTEQELNEWRSRNQQIPKLYDKSHNLIGVVNPFSAKEKS